MIMEVRTCTRCGAPYKRSRRTTNPNDLCLCIDCTRAHHNARQRELTKRERQARQGLPAEVVREIMGRKQP
jgi:hypothetical protein